LTTRECPVVAALEQAIAQRISAPRYRMWFEHKTKFRWDDGQLVVGTQNRFHQEWLQHAFAEAVRAAAVEVSGADCAVRFTIDPALFQEARAEQREARPSAQAPPAPHPALDKPALRGEAPRRPVRRWRRLEDFVAAPCNRLAHAAALSIVEAPAQYANPLVLYGPVSTGKTHLLEGIRSGLVHAQPDWNICLVSAEEFTNRFLQAMHTRQMGPFRKQFRECDVLMVDDLHFLANKRVTQEEFVNTFDVLQAAGKQVAVSCDCHPRLAEDFIPELTDRLLGGAIWGLEPPDGAARLAILRARAGRTVPDDVLLFLASQLRGNVRELEGALHSVRHFSQVTGRAMDVALAGEALADLLRHSLRVVQLSDIDQQLCLVLQLEARALQSKQRSWAVSHPRMLAMHLARKHTAASYSEIGQHFGGRNHSTVVAAEKKVRQWLQADGEMQLGRQRLRVREVIERVERALQR